MVSESAVRPFLVGEEQETRAEALASQSLVEGQSPHRTGHGESRTEGASLRTHTDGCVRLSFRGLGLCS